MAGRFLKLLSERPRLIVSIPRNSPELACAAADGGADALKVHINVRHEASGNSFGDLAQERENLEQILSLGLPTGIVPGAGEQLPTQEEMRELASMGVDFFDLYAHDMPAWLVYFTAMTRMVAIDHTTTSKTVSNLEALGCEMIEAAIVPHEGYGKNLRVSDLAAYLRVRRATKLPIIVPTQRVMLPEEAAFLVNHIGINAIMIGVIVTGTEPSSLRTATARFANALTG